MCGSVASAQGSIRPEALATAFYLFVVIAYYFFATSCSVRGSNFWRMFTAHKTEIKDRRLLCADEKTRFEAFQTLPSLLEAHRKILLGI